MADLDPSRNEPQKWGRHSKTGALWALVLLLAWVAVSYVKSQGQPAADFTYSEFRRQLESDNVEKVTVIDQRRMTGELREPVTRNNQEMVAFETTLPGDLSPELEETMLSQGVIMEGKRDQ